MAYDRRKTAQTNVKPLGEYINSGLQDIVRAIITEGSQQNRHMDGSIEDKRWYRTNVEFTGENTSDLPAESFGMIEFEKGIVTARCTYKEVGGANRDARFQMKLDEDPSNFISQVARFLVGV